MTPELEAEARRQLEEELGWLIYYNEKKDEIRIHFAAGDYRIAIHTEITMWNLLLSERIKLLQAQESIKELTEKVKMMEEEFSGLCGCEKCNPHIRGRRMFLCPHCGDKRCPKALDHENECAGIALTQKLEQYEEALKNLVAAEDKFVKEAGIDLNDEIAVAVRAARTALGK